MLSKTLLYFMWWRTVVFKGHYYKAVVSMLQKKRDVEPEPAYRIGSIDNC